MANKTLRRKNLHIIVRSEPTVDADNPYRPRYRGQCVDATRPCPWVGCRYHLFLNATNRGGIQFPHGDDLNVLYRMDETCALDVAERGGEEYSELAPRLRMSAYGARLSATKAIARLHGSGQVDDLAPDDAQVEWDMGVKNACLPRRRRTERRPDLGGFLDDG